MALRLTLLVVLLFASPAAASTWSLFVGVADYQHPSASLRPLKAPPNDVAAIKVALAPRFGDFGRERSITLLNAAATRQAILQALADRLERARSGDQILFYYSGHGGQVFLQESRDALADEADGKDETLIPYDARAPGGQGPGDILDDELRAWIAAANAKGVSIVTIFDSCNSGSATRGEAVARGVSEIPVLHGARPRPAAQPAALGVSNLALSAARDREQAWEDRIAGQPRGLFTLALERALAALPADAAYRDLLDATNAQLAALRADLGYAPGERVQQPRAEGDLLRTVGAAGAAERRVFPMVREADGTVRLRAGAVVGVLPGARFALYASAAAAANGRGAPLALAEAVEVGPSQAVLRIAGGWRAGAAFARETARRFVPATAGVTLEGSAAALAPRLAAFGLIRARPDTAAYVLKIDDGALTVATPGGGVLARLPAARADEALLAIAHVESILHLAGGEPPAADLEILKVEACREAGCLARSLTPASSREPGRYALPARQLFATRLTGHGPARYVHTLLIGPDFSVRLLYPPAGAGAAGDNRLADGDSAVPTVLRATPQPGPDRIVLIAADAPLDLAGLERGPLVWRPSRTRGEAAAPKPATAWSVVVRTVETLASN